MIMKRFATCLTLFILCGLLTERTTQADTLTFSFDTSSLMGHAAGPFLIDFQFIDGDGSTTDGDSANDNTITITNFMFGSGMALGSPILVGGASGSLQSGAVTLTETTFFNAFTQEFTPGAILNFTVNTTNQFLVGTPDGFSFAILNGLGREVLTNDPSNLNRLLALDIGSSVIVSGPYQISAVPEPTTMLMLGIGLAGLAARVRQHRHKGSQM